MHHLVQTEYENKLAELRRSSDPAYPRPIAVKLFLLDFCWGPEYASVLWLIHEVHCLGFIILQLVRILRRTKQIEVSQYLTGITSKLQYFQEMHELVLLFKVAILYF